MTRTASEALRSYLPETRLKQRRDSAALWLKYLARFPESRTLRRQSLLSFGRDCVYPDDTSVYEPYKCLGGLAVSGDERCPATGEHITDDSFFRIYQGDKDVVMLHAPDLSGAHGVREDLSKVSEYIQEHDTLKYRSHVVAVTYSEMARLTARAGFQSLEVVDIDTIYKRGIQASHQVFCALSKVQRSCEVTMTYMPTEEFVERFTPNVLEVPTSRANVDIGTSRA